MSLAVHAAPRRIAFRAPAAPANAASSGAGVALIGVPFGLGAGQAGTEHAPEALRAMGFAQRLMQAGLDCADKGDVLWRNDSSRSTSHSTVPGRHGGPVSAMIAAVKQNCAAALGQGHIPLVMGGDHSVAMGSVAAAQEAALASGKRLKLLWIDAHADFNVPATSPSGNLHGMALAHAHGAPELDALGSMPAVPVAGEDMLVFGARDIDAGERQRLDRHGVRRLNPSGIDALRAWLMRIDASLHHLHVSFDVDVFDPKVAPGVGTPVPGGLSIAAGQKVMQAVKATGALGSLDLVEINPVLDPSGRTAEAGVAMVLEALAGCGGAAMARVA
jgi:arginase